jgi:hypothetical protein
MAQMIRIGPLIYIEKWCLIAVINMVNYIVDFYTFFILLLFWWININYLFFIYFSYGWICDKQIITWHFPYRPWYHPETPISAQGDSRGLIWVEGWYQGQYGKGHVIIYIYQYGTSLLHKWLKKTCIFYSFK